MLHLPVGRFFTLQLALLFFFTVHREGHLCAQSLPESIEQRLVNEKSDSIKIVLLLQFANDYEFIDNQTATKIVDRALSLANSEKYNWAKALGYNKKSYLNSIQGNFSEALQYDLKSLALFEQLGDSAHYAEVLNDVGVDYRDIGWFDLAYEYLRKSQSISIQINDSIRLNFALFNLGNLFNQFGEYERARYYLDLSVDLSKRLHNKEDVGWTNHEFGRMEWHSGNAQKAEQLLRLAARQAYVFKLALLLPRVQLSLATFYLEKKDFEKAKSHFDSAARYAHQYRNDFLLAQTDLGLGMIESERENYREAQRLLKQSLNEFKALHAFQYQLTTQKLLAKAYGQTGDLKKAIELTNQYFFLEDSLQKVSVNLSVLHKEVVFETEEIKKMKEVQWLQKRELEKRTTEIEIFILITLVISLLSLFLYQSRRRSKLMNVKLLVANEELQAIEKELRAHLNQVTELQDSLKVKEQLYRELVEDASDVIYEIDENGKFTYVNEVAEKLTEYSREEILSMHFWDIVHPETRDEVVNDLVSMMKQAVPTAYRELPLLTKNNNKIWIGQNVKFQYEDNWLVKARVVARDITKIKDAQQKQKAEHELLRTIIDVIPINIYVKDRESRKVMVNRAELEYLGAKNEEEILGKNDFDLYPEKSASNSRKEDLKVLEGHSIIGVETLSIRKDGTHCWFLISKVPMRDETGNISGIVGISIDITEKKLSLEALMFKASPVPLALKNPNTGLFIEINESFVHLMRAKSKSELVGHTSLELLIYEPGERDKIMSQYQLDQPLKVEEVHMRRITGEPFVAKVSGHPFNYQEEHYLLLYYIDITERIESELKLQRINQELSAIFHSTHVSIISTDLNGVITNFSKGAEALLQYKGEEMVGIHTPAIIHVEEEVAKRGKELTAQFGREIKGFDVVAEFPRQGKFESREWTYVRKDGSTFPVQLVATSLRNETGDINGFIGVATDLTERKEAEATLRKYENLQAKNKELEQFNYIASHDLQEPLRTLTSLVEIVNSDYRSLLDQKGIQIFQYISEATSRMHLLVKDLLDYGRLSQAGESKTVNLDQLLRAVLSDLDSSIQASDAEINAGALPEVDGYETALRLLFQNLISNAIKFVRPGKKPVISLGAEKIKKTGKWLFYVQDNGIGIDPKHFEKIFIVFKRLNNREEFPGTGIGLAQCKKIVEMHGGIIWVESAEGEGSKFCFTLS